MAVQLLGASDARLDFGAALLGGGGGGSYTGLTVAFTIKVASSVVGSRFFTKWGSSQTFLVQLLSTAEIGFVLRGTPSGAYGAYQTTDSPVAANALLRVVCRWNMPTTTATCWVNGSARASSLWFGGLSAGDTVLAGADHVQAGHETLEATDGINGEYSELAIWGEAVPDWVARAYGLGFSPGIYRKNGLFYCPAWNTSYLIDQWGGFNGTNSSGTTVAHPSVQYLGCQSVAVGTFSGGGGGGGGATMFERAWRGVGVGVLRGAR